MDKIEKPEKKKSWYDWFFFIVIPSFFNRNRERCSWRQYKSWRINGRNNEKSISNNIQ